MSRVSTGLYEFGPFGVDLRRRVFMRDGQVLPLAPKTFDLLILLVQSPGRAFSKQELMNALWPDTFVEEANLSFQISVLRKGLGDDGARWIETVPKYGYRFTADVRPTEGGGNVPAEPLPARDEPVSVRSGRRITKLWVAGMIVTAALLIIGSFLTRARDSRTDAIRASPPVAVPLTAYPGFEQVPTLSPDGSQVAFSWNGSTPDNHDIYVKLVGPGEPVRLTTNSAADDFPAWSPDGRLIAFLRVTSPITADLIVIPALGGAEKTIAAISPLPIPRRIRGLGNRSSKLCWTPDGRWLTFGGALSPDGPRGIWLISIDGGKQRRLTDAPRGGHDTGPTFSPDGRHLAFQRQRAVGRSAIFVLPVTSDWAPSGTPSQLTSDDSAVGGLAWTPEGRDVVFSSGGHLGLSRTAKIPATPQTARMPEPEPLTFGEHASALSISRTGRLVYAAQFRDTALYELALPRSSTNPIALSGGFSSTFDEQTPAYSPDGKRLAFTSTRSGAEEIWIANKDGSTPLQMTSMGGPQCSNPQWSPDGRAILFDSRRAGSADLYLLQPDTGKLTQLTHEPADENEGRWSRDGRWIYYGSNRTGRSEIWRMPATGGAPTQITRQGGGAAIESRDGFVYYAKDGFSPTSIWRVPIEGGNEVRIVDGLTYTINFAVGERGLYFVASGDTPDEGSVDYFDLATGKRSTLVRLDKLFWWGMTLSPDERSLVLSVVDSAGSNLMLVERFR